MVQLALLWEDPVKRQQRNLQLIVECSYFKGVLTTFSMVVIGTLEGMDLAAVAFLAFQASPHRQT